MRIAVASGRGGTSCPVIESMRGADYVLLVTEAQIRKLSVVEHQADGCAEDIRVVWGKVSRELGEGHVHG